MARILIVEDDPDIAGLMAHYLERAGHQPVVLGGGGGVLPRVRADRPDLIVLDVMLPGLDGLAICRALRADPATAAIPIIRVTARADENDRIAGLELGADDYVTKPFSPKELVARVAALLRRTATPATAGRVVRYGPLVVDGDSHRPSPLEQLEVSLGEIGHRLSLPVGDEHVHRDEIDAAAEGRRLLGGLISRPIGVGARRAGLLRSTGMSGIGERQTQSDQEHDRCEA
jgi:DNA-binding response OmpR family regulator